MSTRIILATILAAFITSPVDAAGPFGWRGIKRKAAPTKPSKFLQLPTSPEKLTELFGPSILVREARANIHTSGIDARKRTRFFIQSN